MYSIREWEDFSSFGAPTVKWELINNDGNVLGVLFEEDFARYVCDAINVVENRVTCSNKYHSLLRGKGDTVCGICGSSLI